MIVFSFLGGAAVYRAKVHIAVRAVWTRWPRAGGAPPGLVDAAMALTCLFMVVWGGELVRATFYQVIAEFPVLSVGLTYAPLPLGGLITLLFIIERAWLGEPPPTSLMYRDEAGGGRVDLPPAMDALVLIGAFILLCAIGMPVAYTLGLSAAIAALWVGIPLEAVMLKISDGTDDFALLAIPFFVLAGAIMAEGGMARRLVDLAQVLMGFIRGGLAVVNILASTSSPGCRAPRWPTPRRSAP